MAVQMGILPLQGTIGNINFYKSGDRYFARTKGGPTANRIATDPKFERSRENAAEFGTGAKGGKLLRTAFQSLVQQSSADKRMVRRLTSKMISVLQADTRSERGKRKLTDGKVELLEGFEFNEQGKLSTTFFAPYASDVNRVRGELRISIPPFVPQNLVTAPAGATHFKFNSGGAEVDFENASYTADLQSSAELALNNLETDEIEFKHIVTTDSTHPLFLLLGVEFFQQVNASMYSLNDSAFNALAIVKVLAS